MLLEWRRTFYMLEGISRLDTKKSRSPKHVLLLAEVTLTEKAHFLSYFNGQFYPRTNLPGSRILQILASLYSPMAKGDDLTLENWKILVDPEIFPSLWLKSWTAREPQQKRRVGLRVKTESKNHQWNHEKSGKKKVGGKEVVTPFWQGKKWLLPFKQTERAPFTSIFSLCAALTEKLQM